MALELSVFASFAAGLFSFLSPCVLPLIPSFLSVLGGVGFTGKPRGVPDNPAASGKLPPVPAAPRRHILVIATLSFIAGFSCVFAGLAIAAAGASLLSAGVNRLINAAAGIIVIVFGLNIIFGFLSFLNSEKRFRPRKRPRGIIGAFLTGAAFGAGWSPCVGPILGSILLLAGTSGEPGRAVLYLAAYSAGLGLPFLSAAVFFTGFRRRLTALTSRLPFLRILSGLFLVAMGVLILLGRFVRLNAFFLKTGGALAALSAERNPAARFIPAAVFFLAAFGFFALGLARRRAGKKNGWGAVPLACGIPLLAGVFQAAGVIDCAAILARWLVYQGL